MTSGGLAPALALLLCADNSGNILGLRKNMPLCLVRKNMASDDAGGWARVS